MINYVNFGKTVCLVAGLSVGINFVLLFLGKVLSAPSETFDPYWYSHVAFYTVVGVLTGALAYSILRMLISDVTRANKYFIILSTVILLISFHTDLLLVITTKPNYLGWTYVIIANLMLMHVVAAGLVMKFFTSPHRS